MISGGGGGIVGGAGGGLGFGDRMGGNQPSRQKMRNHLFHSLEQQRLKEEGLREWNYKGEEADYNFLRKTDKETPKAEMKEKLELLHKWYPNETFEEMQEKTSRVKNKFLLWFPKADMKKFSVLEHPNTGLTSFLARGQFLAMSQKMRKNWQIQKFWRPLALAV